VRVWPRASLAGRLAAVVLVLLGAIAAYQDQVGVAIAIGLLLAIVIALGAEGTATATRLVLATVEELGEDIGQAGDGRAGAVASRRALLRLSGQRRLRRARALAARLEEGGEQR
jgi:hypothetical protein